MTASAQDLVFAAMNNNIRQLKTSPASPSSAPSGKVTRRKVVNGAVSEIQLGGSTLGLPPTVSADDSGDSGDDGGTVSHGCAQDCGHYPLVTKVSLTMVTYFNSVPADARFTW